MSCINIQVGCECIHYSLYESDQAGEITQKWHISLNGHTVNKITTLSVSVQRAVAWCLQDEPADQHSSCGPSSTAQSTALSGPGSAPSPQGYCWAAGGQSPGCRPPWPPHRWSGRSHTARCPAAFSLCIPYQAKHNKEFRTTQQQWGEEGPTNNFSQISSLCLENKRRKSSTTSEFKLICALNFIFLVTHCIKLLYALQ